MHGQFMVAHVFLCYFTVVNKFFNFIGEIVAEQN